MIVSKSKLCLRNYKVLWKYKQLLKCTLIITTKIAHIAEAINAKTSLKNLKSFHNYYLRKKSTCCVEYFRKLLINIK